jgi:hypothetical protein
MAAMSGVGPLLLNHHHKAQLVWIGMMVVLFVRVIVLMSRLKKDEGCEKQTSGLKP